MVLRTMLSDRLNDLSLLNSAAEADWHNALYMEHSLSPVSSRLLGDDHCSLMLPATRGYVPKGGGLRRLWKTRAIRAKISL